MRGASIATARETPRRENPAIGQHRAGAFCIRKIKNPAESQGRRETALPRNYP